MNKYLLSRETVAVNGMPYTSLPCTVKLWSGLLMLLLSVSWTSAQVKIVKDINQSSGDEKFIEMISFHGKAYTVTRHDDSWPAFDQLWVSDGTYEGTQLLMQFAEVKNLTVSGTHLYFTASEFVPDCAFDYEPCEYIDHGSELWTTDGTPEGTNLLKDINPGTAGSNPNELTDMNGMLYFVGNDGKKGKEVWRSDGTAVGTVIVKDIMRVVGSSNPRYLTVMNDHLYFTANDGQNGYELWRSDGTSTGTSLLVDIVPSPKSSSNPQQIVNANGTLFFFATDPVNGRQLWKSNGESNDATLVKVIRPGQSNALDLLTSVNSLVFFQANDGIHGVEPWRSDGTSEGTFLLKDITPGPGSATDYATPHIRGLQSANGKLYFTAVENGENLWASDGTTAGTVQLTIAEEIGFGWLPSPIMAFKGETYFSGGVTDFVDNHYLPSTALFKTNGTPESTIKVKGEIDEGDGINDIVSAVIGDIMFFTGYDAIWKTDGTTAGTEKVRELNSPSSSSPRHLTDVNGTLFFEANGGYLWKSAGTAETTEILKSWSRYVRELKNINGILYYASYDYRHGEPWKSDGTTDGSVIIKDIAQNSTGVGIRGSDPSEFTFFNDHTYFRAAPTSDQPYILWKTDGTEAGTIPSKASQNFINPSSLTVAGDRLFFMAETLENGKELWATDGTTQGTALVKDIKAGTDSSGAIRFTPFNGLLYFQADDGIQGYELWRSDGTRGGTFRLKNLRTNDFGSPSQLAPLDMGNMMATTDYLYFVARTGSGKNGLWKSNGTYAGTTLVKVFAGIPDADIISTMGTNIVYALSYGTYVELWTSDGTLEGTMKIKDIADLHSIVYPYEIARLNDVIYFLGRDGQQSRIWRTDGTTPGTYAVPFKGVPYELETSAGKVYLSADTERWGWELLWIDDDASTTMASATSARIRDEAASVEVFSAGYPNPFLSEFTLRVNGKADELFEMNVVSMDGKADHYSIACNTDHVLGGTWAPGVYVLQIFNSKGYAIHKVIKK